jgi:hypothetical protein
VGRDRVSAALIDARALTCAYARAGTYCDTVDFDPGPGTDVRTSEGCFDAYVTRFHSDGSHVWTRTWGSAGRESTMGVAVAPDGSVDVTGSFDRTIDLERATSSRAIA